MQMEGPAPSLSHGKNEEAGFISTILQCHCDASLEVGQTQQAKGAVCNEITLISDASCKFGGLQATSTSDQLATNSGEPTTPLCLRIHENDSQNSGSLYSYDCNFVIYGTNEDGSDEKTCGVRSRRASNTELLHPLPVESGHVKLSTWVLTNREALWSPLFRVCTGVSLHSYDQMDNWLHDGTQYPAPPPHTPSWRSRGHHLAHSHKPLMTRLSNHMIGPHPELSPKHEHQCDTRTQNE